LALRIKTRNPPSSFPANRSSNRAIKRFDLHCTR
jgi:hypothetical protein